MFDVMVEVRIGGEETRRRSLSTSQLRVCGGWKVTVTSSSPSISNVESWMVASDSSVRSRRCSMPSREANVGGARGSDFGRLRAPVRTCIGANGRDGDGRGIVLSVGEEDGKEGAGKAGTADVMVRERRRRKRVRLDGRDGTGGARDSLVR